jgi:hypothetical protein
MGSHFSTVIVKFALCLFVLCAHCGFLYHSVFTARNHIRTSSCICWPNNCPIMQPFCSILAGACSNFPENGILPNSLLKSHESSTKNHKRRFGTFQKLFLDNLKIIFGNYLAKFGSFHAFSIPLNSGDFINNWEFPK